jgi:hypothetical protein
MFNPRTDRWTDHFAVAGHVLIARTEIAEVTLKLPRLNFPERVAERSLLQHIGEFPQ